MKKVWIDAGHGGKDSGAVANGFKEKNIALTVSLAIRKQLLHNEIMAALKPFNVID